MLTRADLLRAHEQASHSSSPPASLFGVKYETKVDARRTAPPDDRPLNPPVLERVRLVDAPPFGEGLNPAPSNEPTTR